MTATMNGASTDKSTMRELFDGQKHAFRRHTPLGYKKRQEALDALLQGILRYEGAFIEALNSDFGRRSAYETRILEIFPLVDEIRHIRRNLRGWMRPQAVAANWQFLPSRARIVYQPLGVVGVIGAWNYQLLLTLSPLANALAAGNHAIVKPSEHAPRTAELMQKMIGELFPQEYVAAVTGDKEVSAEFAALPFDHLIFTGSSATGRLVMKAAAENLTPVTLELGGKSPALIHDSYPIEAAADRVCSAKFWNAGQTCVAPDYVLVPEDKAQAFAAAAEAAVAHRFPQPDDNPDYTGMIHEAAWRRMHDLVDDAAGKGGEVVRLSRAHDALNAQPRIFAPTLVMRANDAMRVMQEEIFGPILPVIPYRNFEEALRFINDRPRPLALYYFDRDRARIAMVLENTTSGGVTVNDCIFHFPQHNLPFGGVGPSGMGAYHGHAGFRTFSKAKGVLLQNSLTARFLSRALKPPYAPWSARLISLLTGKSKPGAAKQVTLDRDR